jgi:hypothetical protein
MTDDAERAAVAEPPLTTEPIPAAFSAPPAPVAAVPYAGAGAAKVTLVGLAVCASIDVVQVLTVALIRWSMDAHVDDYGEWYPPEWLLSLDVVVSVLPLLALIGTGIAFLTWFSRAHAHASSRSPIAGGPVIAWFIPIMSLWLPYQRMADVWTVVTGRPKGVVLTWWGLWLAQSFVSRGASLEPTTMQGLNQMHFFIVASSGLSILTAVLAGHLVSTIDQAARSSVPATF